jgi:hypothetical protein
MARKDYLLFHFLKIAALNKRCGSIRNNEMPFRLDFWERTVSDLIKFPSDVQVEAWALGNSKL